MLPIDTDTVALDLKRIDVVLRAVAGRRIAVVGDVMLDRYFLGSVSRISPEAPVPVVEIDQEQEYPGGAANVGYNLVGLGASPFLLGVVGEDPAGAGLRTLLNRLGIDAEHLVVDPLRPTTVKTRVIAASQHICRVDRERRGPISSDVEDQLVERFSSHAAELDALIIQDYNKGVITPRLIEHIMAAAATASVPVYVDPKFENFFAYRGAAVFKPNRKEAEDALGRSIAGRDALLAAAGELLERIAGESIVLTLGAEGMLLAERSAQAVVVPTRAIRVADVSGAGDTVIAALAAARAAGASMIEAVEIANHAAGIVCGYVGTVPIDREELRRAIAEIDADAASPSSAPFPGGTV